MAASQLDRNRSRTSKKRFSCFVGFPNTFLLPVGFNWSHPLMTRLLVLFLSPLLRLTPNLVSLRQARHQGALQRVCAHEAGGRAVSRNRRSDPFPCDPQQFSLRFPHVCDPPSSFSIQQQDRRTSVSSHRFLSSFFLPCEAETGKHFRSCVECRCSVPSQTGPVY